MLIVGTNSNVHRAYAIAYFQDMLHGGPFIAASDTMKDQSLVTATAMLDRQEWVGEKVDPAQLLDWARTGVQDPDGNTFPTNIFRALTAAIAAPGTGYIVNDTIILAGGTFTQAVVLNVLTVGGGGAITGIQVSKLEGAYTGSLPSQPQAQASSSGSGTGATFNIAYGVDIPLFMKQATCELAVALINNQSIMNSPDGSSNIHRLKASTAEIWYFKPLPGPRFPTIVDELVGFYLSGVAGSSVTNVFASGSGVTGLDDFDLTAGY